MLRTDAIPNPDPISYRRAYIIRAHQTHFRKIRQGINENNKLTVVSYSEVRYYGMYYFF